MNIDEIKNIIMESDTDDLSEITECISKRLRDIFEDNGKRREMYEVAKKYYSLLNKGNENMDLNEKLKLKEDLDGNKVTDVRGIRAACKVMKTRYSKPFESVQVKIPYETGMNPYSGLVDLFEKKGVLVQQGNRLKYIDKTGKEHIDFRKQWIGDKLDMLMADFKEDTDFADKVEEPEVKTKAKKTEPIKETK